MGDCFFPNEDTVRAIAQAHGTPVFAYDEATLRARAADVAAFEAPFGLQPRYAMKACPTAAILRVFHDAGLHFDASSGYEARRAMLAGIPGPHIQLTAQELPADLADLVGAGVLVNACSLGQLEACGKAFPGSEVGVRMNPGLGSGHSNRTNTGGPSASFGIWHEKLADVLAIAAAHGLRIGRMHTHIGSGADPAAWVGVARMALDLAARLPEAHTVSLGGGFKVGRMPDEATADLREISRAVAPGIAAFAEEHGRRLRLEIEPGTYLVAQAGALIAAVVDVVDTGEGGYRFIKTDTGMTEILRPSMYGALHPVRVVTAGAAGDARPEEEALVVGHCCESGDILTPAPGNPEGLLPRRLPAAKPGDFLVVGGAGAYCSGMAAKNYNSFPEAPEVLIEPSGALRLIRKRQTLEQMLANEV